MKGDESYGNATGFPSKNYESCLSARCKCHETLIFPAQEFAKLEKITWKNNRKDMYGHESWHQREETCKDSQQPAVKKAIVTLNEVMPGMRPKFLISSGIGNPEAKFLIRPRVFFKTEMEAHAFGEKLYDLCSPVATLSKSHWLDGAVHGKKHAQLITVDMSLPRRLMRLIPTANAPPSSSPATQIRKS